MRRWGIVLGCLVAVAAGCSSEHDAADIGRAGGRPTGTSTAPSDAPASSTAPSTASSSPTSAAPASSAASPAPSAPGDVLRGTAVAGTAGDVEPGTPPYTVTDPFAEAVRLADGTCTGWPDSRGGSTAGLVVGAPVAVLDPTTNALLGEGTVTASRWDDPSGGGGEWTCWFDFEATVPDAPDEVLVKVGVLEPWTARPDPRDPARKVASVSTDASIAAIASCPALPETTTTTTAPGASPPPTTAPATTAAPTTTGAPVTGWQAIGSYWSVGVDALCAAGLPVVSLARPCREPDQGSERIVDVVDADRSTVHYSDGDAIPAGTRLTVVVATGRPCD